MRGEKLRYIHRNPVKRGLVEKLEEWKWSGFGTMRVGKKVWSRLSRNEQRGSGSEWGFIQRSEDANQPELPGLRTERERPGHPSPTQFATPTIFQSRVYVGAANLGSGKPSNVYVFGLCSTGPSNNCISPQP